VRETFAAIPPEYLGEVIVIDDGSSDGTGAEVKALIADYPNLRYIRHAERAGQSAAIRTGVLAAQCALIATMDGDGQNDPADIPKLLARVGVPGSGGAALVGGVRNNRKAQGSRRFASLIANKVRHTVFKDNCPDSGCGIKVYWREAYLRLPFFTSMHRFMPALFLTYDHTVDYLPVNDRLRVAGRSKYTNFNRMLIGLYDLFGVVWLRRRTRIPKIAEDSVSVAKLGDFGGKRGAQEGACIKQSSAD
jgi:dolichol-phosphate mannosyltransferase